MGSVPQSNHVYVFRETIHLDCRDTDTAAYGEITTYRGDVMCIKKTLSNGIHSVVIHHLDGPGEDWGDETLEVTPEVFERMLEAKVLKAIPI